MSITADETAVRTKTPLVARIYANYPCFRQGGGKAIVPDSIIDLGDPGPVVLFWQCSGMPPAADRRLRVEPHVNGKGEPTLAAGAWVNPSGRHQALLRRRALVAPLPPHDNRFAVVADDGTATDQNDRVSMVALDISDMSAPPVVRLSEWGQAAAGDVGYTKRSFTSEGGPLVISLAATARPKSANTTIGGILWLDNQPVGYIQVHANNMDQHIHLVGGDRVVKAAAGSHEVRFIPDDKSIVDGNDTWNLTVMEMRSPSSATSLLDNAEANRQPGGGVIGSAQYESKGGDHLICAHVSGYAAKENTTLRARVYVDENPVGTLEIHANPAATHMVLCGGDVGAGSIPKGTRAISVRAEPGLITDQNDRISLTVIEVFR